MQHGSAQSPQSAKQDQIECLACGAARIGSKGIDSHAGECPRCGYLGWARSADLGERARRSIRDRALALH
jgi:hypothetical protein